MNVSILRSQSLESIECAFHQPRRDQFIPAAGDNCKAKGLSVKTSFMNCRLQAIRLRDLNSHYVLQYRRCFETHQVDEFCRCISSSIPWRRASTSEKAARSLTSELANSPC